MDTVERPEDLSELRYAPSWRECVHRCHRDGPRFPSSGARKELLSAFACQINILHEMVRPTKQAVDAGKPLLNAILSRIFMCGSAIHLLGSNVEPPDAYVAEDYVLARSFVENSVNYCFLRTSEDEAYSDFVAYGMQKPYWLGNQKIVAGQMKYELTRISGFDLNEFPDLAEAVAKFSTRKGKPIRKWTQLSVAERIGRVRELGYEHAMLLLHAYAGISEKASEIQHGSLWGCGFQVGYLQESIEDSHLSYQNRSLGLLYVLLSLCAHAVIQIGSPFLGAAVLSEISKANISEIRRHFNHAQDAPQDPSPTCPQV